MDSKDGSGKRGSPVPWLTLLLIVTTLAIHAWQVHVAPSGWGHIDTMLWPLDPSATWRVLASDCWRLFSSPLLPVPLLQLSLNMAGLLIIGSTLERCVARWQWLMLYLGGGAFSQWVAGYWHNELLFVSLEPTVTPFLFKNAGASGAIISLGAGLMGILYWADLLEAATVRRIFGNRLTRWMFKASGVFLLAMTLAVVWDKGAGYSGYIAGGVFGLLAGAALCVPRCSTTRGVKWAGTLLPVFALVLACTLITCVARTHSTAGFVRVHALSHDLPQVP